MAFLSVLVGNVDGGALTFGAHAALNLAMTVVRNRVVRAVTRKRVQIGITLRAEAVHAHRYRVLVELVAVLALFSIFEYGGSVNRRHILAVGAQSCAVFCASSHVRWTYAIMHS